MELGTTGRRRHTQIGLGRKEVGRCHRCNTAPWPDERLKRRRVNTTSSLYGRVIYCERTHLVMIRIVYELEVTRNTEVEQRDEENSVILTTPISFREEWQLIIDGEFPLNWMSSHMQYRGKREKRLPCNWTVQRSPRVPSDAVGGNLSWGRLKERRLFFRGDDQSEYSCWRVVESRSDVSSDRGARRCAMTRSDGYYYNDLWTIEIPNNNNTTIDDYESSII